MSAAAAAAFLALAAVVILTGVLVEPLLGQLMNAALALVELDGREESGA